MSLEQAFRQRWSSDAALVALVPLVPLVRVFTGVAAKGTALPYVVMTREREDVAGVTSSGNALSRVRMKIAVWVDDLDVGKQIAVAIGRCFDRSSFDWADGSVLNMQLDGASEAIQNDGTWQVAREYVALVEC